MPKKFQGENSKSAAARARKAEQKAAADAKRQQELEDAYWKDDDKHVARKEQRKVEKEKKRVEQLERKKETQRLLEEEGSSTKPKISKPVMPAKITRAQIEETVKKDNMGQSTEEVKGKQMSHLEMPLEENINRIVPEEGQVDARTIEDAIAALSDSPEDLETGFPDSALPSLLFSGVLNGARARVWIITLSGGYELLSLPSKRSPYRG